MAANADREKLVDAYRDAVHLGLFTKFTAAARAALLAALTEGEEYEVIHSFGIPFVRLPLSYKPGDTVRVSKVNTT